MKLRPIDTRELRTLAIEYNTDGLDLTNPMMREIVEADIRNTNRVNANLEMAINKIDSIQIAESYIGVPMLPFVTSALISMYVTKAHIVIDGEQVEINDRIGGAWLLWSQESKEYEIHFHYIVKRKGLTELSVKTRDYGTSWAITEEGIGCTGK